MAGRDIMKGRHNVGGKLASPGKIRKGGSEPAGNKFKTASSYNTTPKPPVMANQAKTSIDLQSRISGKAPQPFTNTKGAATLPAGTGPRGAVPGQEPKNIYAGKKGSSVGQSNPSGAAVGYSKLPDQSKQIGGRMGYPPPARKVGSQNLSPVKGNYAFFGDYKKGKS